jgi:hypothetical protein
VYRRRYLRLRRRGRDSLGVVVGTIVGMAVLVALVVSTIYLAAPTPSRDGDEPEAASSNPADQLSHPADSGSGKTPVAQPEPPPDYRFHKWHLGDAITFCVNPDGGPAQIASPLDDLVNDAVNIWQRHAEGSLPLYVSGLCPGASITRGDGISVVGWGSLDGKMIGQANVKLSRDRVKEADILLEASLPADLLSEQCLVRLLLHELGHVIGLDHQAEGPSVMTPSLDCSLVPVPSERDIAAVRFLYPPDAN